MARKRITAVLVAALGGGFMASTAMAEHPGGQATLYVQFFDEVGLSGPEAAGLREEFSKVMKRAGVETRWVFCSVIHTEANPPDCGRDRGLAAVVVHLLPNANRRKAHALGMSTTGRNGCGTRAYLYWDQIVGLADRAEVKPVQILPLIALHEVGHLLIGPAHFPTGIMRPYFSERQLDKVVERPLFFNKDLAKRLRTRVAARAQAGTAN